MTTFQLVLAGFGVVLVLGVVLYNWLQERKYRQEASRGFGAPDEDYLARAGVSDATEKARIEPHIQLDDETEARPGFVGDIAESKAETFEADLGMELSHEERAPALDRPYEHAAATTIPEAMPGEFAPESPLDPATEYIARLRFSQPAMVPFASLLDDLRIAGKAVRAMGKHESGGWEPLAGPARGRYTAVEFGLQLADRSGPAGGHQMETFCRVLYEFAAEHGGAVSCQDIQAALERAHALDAFCIEVDLLVGLNVVSSDMRPFKLPEIDRLAVEAGMALQPDGAYALKDGQGNLSYTLTNQGDRPFQPGDAEGVTYGVTLLFDLPAVPGGLAAFDQMAAFGSRLATALGGSMVDDNGKHVGQDSLQKIRQRLAASYARMQERGIPAGGECARRLFV